MSAQASPVVDSSGYAAVFDRSAVGFLIVDLAGRVVDANSAVAAAVGRAVHQLRGLPLREFVHADDAAAVAARWEYLTADRELRVECRLRRGDGRVVWAELTMTLVAGTSVSGPPVPGDTVGAAGFCVVTVKDVTEVRRLRDQLKYRAEHDSLTGLSNRGHFLDRLDATFRESP
nr:PAS domain S-box protein [Micromonospora sp. DSM 115978]